MSQQHDDGPKKKFSFSYGTRLEDIYEKIREDGKRNSVVPTSTFLFVLGLGVPIWATIILPISFIWQTGKAILPGPKKQQLLPSEDDSVPLDFMPENVKSFSARKYDLVLLGATGFTGKLAALYLTQTYGVNGKVKWALAGRSASKLMELKSDIAKEIGNDDATKIETIIVDTMVRSSLHDLVKDTRSVANTAGPFGLYGNNVVEFCAKYGTSYVDITGEKDWSVQMIEKWENVAKKSGAQIISFCGHDSIPWDITASKLTEAMKKECNDDVVKIECFDEVAGGISGGTLATILLSIDGYKAPRFTSDPWIRKADGSSSKHKTKVVMPLFPEKVINVGEGKTKWSAPFLMTLINGEVVKRSNALRSEGNINVEYKEGMLLQDFKTAFVNTAGLIFGATALLNPITRALIEKALPPGQGPTKNALERGYLCVHGLATGSRGSQVESAMYFPKDAGYKDTARMVVESGLCLALDREHLPIKNGGFYTPSTGMGDVLLERLCRTGTMFRYRIRSKL